jgi:hypothetical protein
MKTIDNELFINRNKSISSGFTRNRKLSFKELVVCLMRFTRPGLQTELDRFFRAISDTPNNFSSISKSAFSQSRQKLKPDAFIELNKTQLDYFNKHASQKKGWKGKRVIAIDGSIINLPSSQNIIDEFGFQTNNSESVVSVSALASIAYDVDNELIIDANIVHVNSSERDLAAQHILKLNPSTDIILVDRGYQCYWLVALLEKLGFEYCFRIGTGWSSPVKALRENGNDIDWTAKKFPRMANKDKVPYEKYGLEAIEEIKLRLVKIDIATEEPEMLLTNLMDREQFTLNDLKELYHKRWGVEEGYKSMKKVLDLESFTGKTAIAIKQDFYAKILLLNLASMISLQTISEKEAGKKKHKYKANKTQAVAKTKDFIVDLLLKSDLSEAILQIQKLILKCIEIVRPNRSFPRLPRASRHRSRSICYKGV